MAQALIGQAHFTRCYPSFCPSFCPSSPCSRFMALPGWQTASSHAWCRTGPYPRQQAKATRDAFSACAQPHQPTLSLLSRRPAHAAPQSLLQRNISWAALEQARTLPSRDRAGPHAPSCSTRATGPRSLGRASCLLPRAARVNSATIS